MPDGTLVDGLDDLLRMAQYGMVGKPGGDHTAAVHARDEGVLRVAAQLKRLGDDRRKIPVLPDVGDAGIGDDRGGEYPVGIAGPEGHDAVGGEEHRCRDVLKLPLLVLPCGAKVAFQMRKALFQLRVAVGRQHLRVGVDIDALALGLLQQALGIVEVVARNDDEGAFLDGQGHLHRLRVAKRAGVGSILLLFNMIILEAYSKITEKIMLEKEKTVYEQQIHMMTNNTKEQKKLMEDFHRERHDLINKLIVLKNEIEHGEKENVIREIDKIIENNHTENYISDSGNQVIDALLNTKYSIAKENGIQFLLKIFIPEELPVNQCDLGVVLGNALDNAIEATEKCTGNNKDIEIAMGIKKQSLVLVIKNPYEGYLKQDKSGKLISTKNDFRRHGYGISSIQKVADKYGGDVIIETQDGKFVLTVMMNIGDF